MTSFLKILIIFSSKTALKRVQSALWKTVQSAKSNKNYQKLKRKYERSQKTRIRINSFEVRNPLLNTRWRWWEQTLVCGKIQQKNLSVCVWAIDNKILFSAQRRRYADVCFYFPNFPTSTNYCCAWERLKSLVFTPVITDSERFHKWQIKNPLLGVLLISKECLWLVISKEF